MRWISGAGRVGIVLAVLRAAQFRVQVLFRMRMWYQDARRSHNRDPGENVLSSPRHRRDPSCSAFCCGRIRPGRIVASCVSESESASESLSCPCNARPAL